MLFYNYFDEEKNIYKPAARCLQQVKIILVHQKMRNNFKALANCSFFQYFNSNIWLFSIVRHICSYRSSYFLIVKVVALNLFPSFFVYVTAVVSWLLLEKLSLSFVRARKSNTFKKDNRVIDSTKTFLHFGCTNNIFNDYTFLSL